MVTDEIALQTPDVSFVISQDSHSQFACTTFDDGARQMARPLEEPWSATRLHDLVHHVLAFAQGRPHSKALWNAAHGDGRYTDVEVAVEETQVAALCTMLVDVLR